jgi:hypothetical protein
MLNYIILKALFSAFFFIINVNAYKQGLIANLALLL